MDRDGPELTQTHPTHSVQSRIDNLCPACDRELLHLDRPSVLWEETFAMACAPVQRLQFTAFRLPFRASVLQQKRPAASNTGTVA